MSAINEAEILRRKGYILNFQAHCEKYLAPLADPSGKRVLVVGSGHGTEMLWCLLHGASHVTGIDVRPQDERPLLLALRERGCSSTSFSFLTMGIQDAAGLRKTFDLIISNNVFEHLPDISDAFRVCKMLIQPGQGRIVVFADPLFFSSRGAHFPDDLEPWCHLWQNEAELQAQVNGREWSQFRQLNRMTIIDFLQAIVSNDLIILQLAIVRDRNLDKLPSLLEKMEASAAVTHLALEGVVVELARL